MIRHSSSAPVSWSGSGKYSEAIDIYKELAAKDGPTAIASRRGYCGRSAETGKYGDAEDAGKRFVAGASGAELQNALGEVLRLRGKTRRSRGGLQGGDGRSVRRTA